MALDDATTTTRSSTHPARITTLLLLGAIASGACGGGTRASTPSGTSSAARALPAAPSAAAAGEATSELAPPEAAAAAVEPAPSPATVEPAAASATAVTALPAAPRGAARTSVRAAGAAGSGASASAPVARALGATTGGRAAEAPRAATMTTTTTAAADIAPNPSPSQPAREPVVTPQPATRIAPTPAPAVTQGPLATQWGEEIRSVQPYLPFERRPRPFETLMIHYDHAAAITSRVARGAGARPATETAAYRGGLRFSVQDAQGRALPAWLEDTTLLVAGTSGQAYQIGITNDTDHRFEAVVVVDGVNAQNAQPFDWTQRGFIVPAHSHWIVEGFRRDPQTVARFRFGSVARSYAREVGTAQEAGVIRVQVYAEANAVPPGAF